MAFLDDLIRNAQNTAGRIFAPQPAPKQQAAPVRPGPIPMAAPRGPVLQGPVQQAPAYVQAAPRRPLQVVGGPAFQPVAPRPAPIDVVGLLKTLGSGLQQSAGNIGDINLMGRAVIDTAIVDANPWMSEQGKDLRRMNIYKQVEKERNKIKGAKTVTGESFNPRADFQFTGNPGQDAANLAGRSLQTGLDATMLVNPARAGIAGLTGKQAAKQVAKTAAKEAALFGGGSGTAVGLETYGQTGDARKAALAAAQAAALAGGAQFGLNVGGYAAGRGVRAGANQVKQGIDLHNSMTPAQRQAGMVQLPGGPDYKPSKAVSKAENDFATGKINQNQLENVRQAEAQQQINTLLQERTQAMKAGQSEYVYAAEQKLQALGYDVNKTISTKQKVLASKPVEFLYGDKKVVQDAVANKKAVEAANLTPEQTQQYLHDLTQAQKAAMKGNSNLLDKTGDFKEKFVDNLAPIEDRVGKAIKNGTDLDPLDHITYQLDRSRRAEGVMNAYIKDNQLDKIIQTVDDTNAFDQYLIARHAKELDPEIATGRNAANDAAIVQQLEGRYGVHAQALYQYNQKLLDTSVDYGLISKETAAALKKQYPEYVPFNRIFNEDELATIAGGNGKGDASIATQGVVKKIKGSNRAIASPLNSIIDKTRIVVEQGERNRAAQLLASYKDLPGNPFNLKEIPANETIGSRHTISFLDNGVKRTFETDKEIADAAKNMTRQEIGLWGQIAAVPARVLRGGATAVNVGFAGANVVKDVVGAAINSRHAFRIADPEAVGKALKAALHHNGKEYLELMREGVTGTSFDMYRNPLKSNLGEIRSQKNIGTRAVYNATHPSQWYRTIENTIGRSEDFGRALQYYSNKKGYLADGKSPEVAKVLAADQARNNSTNFFRHGSYGQGINMAIPYWNAGVQGARIQVRRIGERPVQTITKIGFAIAAPSAMIAANNYMDPKKREVIENIPQYEKDGNIIIVGPNAVFNEEKNQWDGVWKFPVPPQHLGIHKTIQDGVRAGVMGEDFDVIANLGAISENYTTINPTDPKALANRYIPQAIKLVAEPMTNTNFYTGNKIVPDSQRNLPAPDQYSDYSSGTAKVLGQLTNTSPRQLDNIFRTGMGGAGQNLINFTDSGLAAAGVIDKKNVRGKNIVDSVTGRFYGPNAINPGDKADKQFEQFKKQITETSEYKNATPYDKSRMLNRLETDLQAVAYEGKNKESGDKLTKKQQSLKDQGFKSATYTSLDNKPTGSETKISSKLTSEDKTTLKKYDDMDDKDRKKWFATENDAEYKYAKAKYENDKAEGRISDIQDIGRKKALQKEEVGSKYSKETRDLYQLGKAVLYDYVTKSPKGQQLADELLAYDRDLVAAGLNPYNNALKFKNGLAPATGGRARKASTGRRRASGGRKRSSGGTRARKATGTAKGTKEPNANASSISNVSKVASVVRNAKVSKKQLPKTGGVRGASIQAYKKPTKTTVAMRRT